MDIMSSKSLLYRSKHRIKKLGEVFTPESCIEEMLVLLSKGRRSFWSDEDSIFFEPCCGHGNIVIKILEKRLSAIYSKAVQNKIKKPAYYAVANAINTLWAIDIDEKNIQQSRARVFITVVEFLREKLNLINDKSVICHDKEFIAHILCAVNWQIHQNETLSAISEQNYSCENACKTLEGCKWYRKNNYRPLNFHQNWTAYFEKCYLKKIIPVEFKRAISCINAMVSNRTNAHQIFDFTKKVLIVD